jgi:hypothetical protein
VLIVLLVMEGRRGRRPAEARSPERPGPRGFQRSSAAITITTEPNWPAQWPMLILVPAVLVFARGGSAGRHRLGPGRRRGPAVAGRRRPWRGDWVQAGSRHIGHMGGPPATANGVAAWKPCRS